jgi:putative redox protein
MTLRLYADQKQWPLERVRVAVRHAKDKDRTPADRFFRRIALDGPLDTEQRARLIEIAGRCPVHRTLEAGSAIESSLTESPHAE